VSRNGRSRTLATLKRISIGGIAEAQDGKFGDVLLADALTSYAKVLGDWPTKSQLRRPVLGPVHHQRALFDTPAAMSDGVLSCTEGEQADWAD
jgi:hypothetical protein